MKSEMSQSCFSFCLHAAPFRNLLFHHYWTYITNIILLSGLLLSQLKTETNSRHFLYRTILLQIQVVALISQLIWFLFSEEWQVYPKIQCGGSVLFSETECPGAFLIWVIVSGVRVNAVLWRCWIWVIILETWQNDVHQVLWICVVLFWEAKAFVLCGFS